MMGIVLRHELRRIARDRAILILILLFGALAAFAGLNGASWVKERQTVIRMAVEESAKPMRAQLERVAKARPDRPVPLRPVAFSYSATLEPLPLAPLSIGQAESYPFAASFVPLMSRHMVFSRYGVGTESARVLAAGRFDLAFLLVFLLPIFLLASTYDLWVEERDRGTAFLVLAQPVRPVPLLAAKALARGGAVLLPAIAITILVLAIVAEPEPLGMLVLSAMLLLYGLFWITLAVAINVFARRASEAAVGAGAAWLILVMIAPALAAALVDIALPPASRADLVNAVRQSELEAQEAGGTILLTGKRGLVGLTPLEVEARFSGGRLAEVRAAEAKVAPMAKALAERDGERIEVTQALRLLFPSVALQNGLDRIAGSDAGRAAAFQASAVAFLDRTRDFFAGFIAERRLMSAADVPRIPRYTPPAKTLAPLLVDAAALLVAILLLLILAAAGLKQRRLFES